MKDFGLFLIAAAGYGASIAALAIGAASFCSFVLHLARRESEGAYYTFMGAFGMLVLSFLAALITNYVVTA